MTRPPFQRGGRFLFLVYNQDKHCRYIIRNFLLEGYYEIIETGIR